MLTPEQRNRLTPSHAPAVDFADEWADADYTALSDDTFRRLQETDPYELPELLND
jgi:hypothetical protein